MSFPRPLEDPAWGSKLIGPITVLSVHYPRYVLSSETEKVTHRPVHARRLVLFHRHLEDFSSPLISFSCRYLVPQGTYRPFTFVVSFCCFFSFLLFWFCFVQIKSFLKWFEHVSSVLPCKIQQQYLGYSKWSEYKHGNLNPSSGCGISESFPKEAPQVHPLPYTPKSRSMMTKVV